MLYLRSQDRNMLVCVDRNYIHIEEKQECAKPVYMIVLSSVHHNDNYIILGRFYNKSNADCVLERIVYDLDNIALDKINHVINIPEEIK